MTQFGPRIEPITSPTPSECANYYATDAGLDLNPCRQAILLMHSICMEVLTVHDNELHLFLANVTPQLILLISCIAAESTHFILFNYDAFWAQNQINHLPDNKVKVTLLINYINICERLNIGCLNNTRLSIVYLIIKMLPLLNVALSS